MFKHLSKAFIPAVILAFMVSEGMSQTITTPRAASPAAKVSQTIGLSTVTVKYSRPAVREREVYGTGLVHYGYQNLGFGTATEAPWRAGANENTIIKFSHDAKVEGKDIPAGTYGFFVGVHEDGKADIIFSKNYSSWGSFFYGEEEDQLRVTVQSEEIAHTERLTFDFINIDKNSAVGVLDWEKKRFPFKVEFAVDDIVLSNAKDELRGTTGFGWQGPLSAANYALNNDKDLDQALTWAEQSITTQKNFNNMSVKAQILAKQGKNDESAAIMDEALSDPTATAANYYTYGRQLIGLEKDDEAMDIFKKLSKKWPDHWLAPHGLARGYSAAGDYKTALKYEKQAVEICPPGSKQFLEGFIAQLEKGEDFN